MCSEPNILSSFLRKLTLFLGLALSPLFPGLSQNQPLADSLETVFLNQNYQEQELLQLLKKITYEQTDAEKILIYSELLIETAQKADSTDYVYSGYLQRGNAFRLKSDLQQALENYFQAALIASDADWQGKLGAAYLTIADAYSIMGNHRNAVDYYQRSIDLLRQERDSINLASALLNAGDEFFNNAKLDSAMTLFRESEQIFRALDFKTGVAYNLGNVGLVYAEQNQDSLAEANINEAIAFLESLQDYYPISVYLIYMSDIYQRKNKRQAAISYAQRSLDLAQENSLRDQAGEAHRKLSELYEASGNFEQAFFHFQAHINYRDSIQNLEAVQNMADLRTDFEISQKQTEIDLLEKEAQLRKARQKTFNYAFGIGLLSFCLIAIGLFRRNSFIKRTTAIIERERKRSDNLLENILPAETAVELKRYGKVHAKRFGSVTVMFTDFKDFTAYSEALTPELMVKSIDLYFSRFDEIMEKYGLEKIKTVGDAYMCAGGLPYVTLDHAKKMTLAALEILRFVETMRADPNNELAPFEIRMGINTGPVIAGVVGTKKFAYDIWGDTVNIAARMEANGEIGRINISQSTYDLIRDDFECEYRGELEVHNKGPMPMYFVTGRKEF